MEDPRRLPHLALSAVALLVALGVGGRVAATVGVLLGVGVEAPFEVVNLGPRVRSVGPAAATAGLAPDDRLLTVAGQPYVGRRVLSRALVAAAAGTSLPVRVRREQDGVARELDLEIPLRAAARRPAREWTESLGLGVFMPLFSAFLGLLVVFRRPRDGRAWLLLMLLLSFPSLFSLGDAGRWPALVRFAAVALPGVLGPSWGLWMLLFGIYFPERARMDERWPWIKWAFVVVLVPYALLRGVVELGASERYEAVLDLASLTSRVGRPMMFVSMAAVGGFFAMMAEKAYTLPSADSRRRLRLLWVGANAGLTPTFAVVLLTLWRGEEAVPAWVFVPALFALPLFPLTLFYVIVVERALDVGMVVRQGLQYALARNGIHVLQGLLSVGLLLGALLLAAEPSANRPRRIMFMAGGVMLVVSLGRLGLHARAFVDRRFFREALDTERLLNELSDDVRTLVDTQTLLETVARRLSDALHTPRVAVLLDGPAGYAAAQAVGLEATPELCLPAAGALVARLRQEGRPLALVAEDPRHWSQGLPPDERRVLQALHAQLLVPLLLKQRLLGILSLGPKLSEQAYSPSDLRLLRLVGAQVGLALENGRLMAEMAAEAARRERLSRELEIAREVQERLFPQELPRIAQLEYDGYCRPARGVGGDYYDFLALSGGRLGLAIGDVSGKGIPAALLMAALQASLRGQATFGGVDLAELMARVNRLICDTSSPNRYATFFYAQFEPGTRTLRYVNAGHNAPMLLKADGRVQRLEHGGPVVGLIEIASYQSADTLLEPGDRLLLYTDGLSEAMNPAEEEWGEERLLEAFRACDGLGARAAFERLVAEADAFAAGAPQHDDMTVIVVRVLP